MLNEPRVKLIGELAGHDAVDHRSIITPRAADGKLWGPWPDA